MLATRKHVTCQTLAQVQTCARSSISYTHTSHLDTRTRAPRGVSEALFLRSMLLEAKLAKKVNVIAHTDSTAGKSMATRFGTGKETKHVELRFLYVQNLVQMGLLRMATAKIDGTRNPADL